MKKKCLNLGCGSDYTKSNKEEIWVNLETDKRLKADVYHNINRLELPFKDDEFDYVFFNHVIEHLSPNLNIMDLFDEISRILKKEGVLELNCPHYSGWNAFGMFHTRYFNLRSFISLPQFDVIQAGMYNTIKHWTMRKDLKRRWYSGLFNYSIEKLANLNPLLCERLWCHWVGGFIEMRFLLKNNKNNSNIYENIGVTESECKCVNQEK